MLGSWAEGAFGTLAADAAFVGVKADMDFGGWRIGANAEIGTVDPATRNGLITEVSPLTTSAFTLHASRSFATPPCAFPSRNRCALSGQASLSVPVGRTRTGEVFLWAQFQPISRQGADRSISWRNGTNRWLSVNFASAPLQLTNRAIAWQRIPN